MGRTRVTDNSLRLAILLAMLVIILAGVKAAADIVVPFLLAVFLAMVLNPLVAMLERRRVPRIAWGDAAGNGGDCGRDAVHRHAGRFAERVRPFAAAVPRHDDRETARAAVLRRRFNISLSSEAMLQYVDPSAAMNLVTRMLGHLSGAMTNVFLLLMTVVFMLF